MDNSDLVPTIEIWFHTRPLEEVLVEIGWNVPERKPNPTKAEVDRCPPTFRCYCCMRRLGRRKYFGGEVIEMRICRGCYPYCDEAQVAAYIRFDRWHGFGAHLFPQDRM